MGSSDLSQKYQRLLQMFWDPEPKNDDPNRQPIFCLGLRYDDEASRSATSSDSSVGDDHRMGIGSKSHGAEEPSWPVAFLDDFESRLWFTYRTDFPAIPRSDDPKAASALTLAVRIRNIGDANGFTSDTGWGCMIRSGQCLLGNALATIKLGRRWTRGVTTSAERQLLSWFADDPKAPFSIHNFVSHGEAYCGKHPGEWFGPSATARCIEALTNSFKTAGLHVYVAEDGAQLYEGSIEMLATSHGKTAFRPVLLLAAIRIGIDRITPIYREALKHLPRLKQSVGIAGGRPSASHYFVAVQGDNFFYLDPHNARPALKFHENAEQVSDEELDSCHTRRLRRLHIDKMDPSMLLAFLITSQEDMREWKAAIQDLPGAPIITLVEGMPPRDISNERQGAIDEVEAFDDDDDDLDVPSQEGITQETQGGNTSLNKADTQGNCTQVSCS